MDSKKLFLQGFNNYSNNRYSQKLLLLIYHLHGAGQPGTLPPVPSPRGIAFALFPDLAAFLYAAAETVIFGIFPGV